MANTSSLQALVRALGVSLVVVEGCHFTGVCDADIPSEPFTASCLQNGLDEAIDNDFED